MRDTFNLASDGICRVVEEDCRLEEWAPDEVAAQNGLSRHLGSSFKGESDIDWSDEDADDGRGPKIRKGTSRDRVVSTTDPEMRHGHKSHSKGFEGYKTSVVADVETGVILATDARPANVADRERSAELVESAAKTAGSAIETVLGDTAYGDTGTRRALEVLGVEVIAEAPPVSSRKRTFKRDEFKVSERRGQATCPAGKKSIRRSPTPKSPGWTNHFSRTDCSSCALRAQCTTAKVGARTIAVTERSKELDRHRRAQRTKRFRRRYRKRVTVEHAIGRLRQKGIGQARYFGIAKVALQVALAAMAANLGLAASCLDLDGVLHPLSASLALLFFTWAVHHLGTIPTLQPIGEPTSRPDV